MWPKEAQNRPGWGPFALPSPELSAPRRWNCGGAADGAGVFGGISPGSQNEKWGFHTEVTEVVMALIFWTG